LIKAYDSIQVTVANYLSVLIHLDPSCNCECKNVVN